MVRFIILIVGLFGYVVCGARAQSSDSTGIDAITVVDDVAKLSYATIVEQYAARNR